MVNIVVNFSMDINTFVNVNSFAAMNDSMNYMEMCNKCLELEAKLIKQHNMVEKDEYNRLSKSFSKLEQHCISLELAMQLNKEIFQKNNTDVNQTKPIFDHLSELNNLKAGLQAKDTTIEKLKANIKRVSRATKSSRSKSTDNTKNDMILQISSSTQKKNKVEDHSRIVNSMFDARHELCFFEFVSDMNGTHSSRSSAQESVVTKVYTRRSKVPKTNGSNSKPKIATSVISKKIEPGTSRGSNTLVAPSSSSLVDITLSKLFVFGNDQIAKIIGYGDYQIWNITISRVYYMEGLGYNLFSVGQFCDSDLEVAYRKHTCFVRNLKGVDLLSGSQETNLYTLSIRDMMVSSLICLLSKASKTKSWLWHRRLSHLNFGAINHLEKNSLVRGLPKVKFEKYHLCLACAIGKSKKQSHKPKSEDTNQEKLYLLHMDLCGPIRVASMNGKKYILVIVDDYSRFICVNFLASKNAAPNFIIKFLKMIQVRLNAPVRNIRTDNGTEFVNQILCSYYKSIGPGLQLMTPATSSSGLVTNPIPQQPCNPPLRDDWDRLFQLMFDEYFNPPTIVVSPVPVANAPRAIDLADSPVST
ncbi:retrovirus-related pol polyprotein from transposon TNT 1-94 [Tanacetum coccineum]